MKMKSIGLMVVSAMLLLSTAVCGGWDDPAAVTEISLKMFDDVKDTIALFQAVEPYNQDNSCFPQSRPLFIASFLEFFPHRR